MFAWHTLLPAGVIALWSLVIFMLGDDTSISDDGMIYLRYAYNLANGYGLVYNPGEYYESNTNFLWSILLAPPFLLGLDPAPYLRALGVAIGGGVLWFSYRLAQHIEGAAAAALVLMLLGLHYSFFIMLNSGFAPHLVSLLALAGLCWCCRLEKNFSLTNSAALCLLMTLLLLTRLDASLLFGVVWLLALWTLWRKNGARHAATAATAIVGAIVCAVPLLVFAVYLLCKQLYYGDIFPASYYAKAGPNVPEYFNPTVRGLKYLWIYFSRYWIVFLLPLLLYGGWRRCRGRFSMPSLSTLPMPAMARLACAAIVLLWCAYMVKIGGGYVEFRLMSTTAPFMFIVIVGALWFNRKIALAACAFLALASVNYILKSESDIVTGDDNRGIVINGYWFRNDYLNDWKNQGISLRETFAEFGEYHPSVKIAFLAGGYIPFYSQLQTMEMYGWADPRISLPENHFMRVDYTPGHNWTASPEFMNAQQVNLVFGNPFTVSKSQDSKEFFEENHPIRIAGKLTETHEHVFDFDYPDDMQIVRLPFTEEEDVLALYLTRNKELDEFFARRGFYRRNIGNINWLRDQILQLSQHGGAQQ